MKEQNNPSKIFAIADRWLKEKLEHNHDQIGSREEEIIVGPKIILSPNQADEDFPLSRAVRGRKPPFKFMGHERKRFN